MNYFHLHFASHIQIRQWYDPSTEHHSVIIPKDNIYVFEAVTLYNRFSQLRNHTYFPFIKCFAALLGRDGTLSSLETDLISSKDNQLREVLLSFTWGS
jgi:hypothetical protein